MQDTGIGSISPDGIKHVGGDHNYTFGEVAAYSESTISALTKEVCHSIVHVLWEEDVSSLFPKSEEDFYQAMAYMESEWQFKFAISAIDGSRLPFNCPAGDLESMKQYQNFKNFYSIVLLGLVDIKYRFIWVALGAPGNTHD